MIESKVSLIIDGENYFNGQLELAREPEDDEDEGTDDEQAFAEALDQVGKISEEGRIATLEIKITTRD